MDEIWKCSMSICPHSIGQSSVTCPYLIIREVGKVSEPRKKRNRFESIQQCLLQDSVYSTELCCPMC